MFVFSVHRYSVSQWNMAICQRHLLILILLPLPLLHLLIEIVSTYLSEAFSNDNKHARDLMPSLQTFNNCGNYNQWVDYINFTSDGSSDCDSVGISEENAAQLQRVDNMSSDGCIHIKHFVGYTHFTYYTKLFILYYIIGTIFDGINWITVKTNYEQKY